MKVPLSWLREFCPTELSADELAEILTRHGIHVEGVLRPWERLSGVVVARVLEVRDHPNSDKLCLARVSYGSGQRELVVGVRNMKEGDLVPLAGPGATLPALPEPLSAREIRGVVSEGMLCSPRELGISADHSGILILHGDLPEGGDVKATFGLDDAVFDIEVKPNRPDLLSVVGVAREAAAATGVPFSYPEPKVEEADDKANDHASVEVRDAERCPRYVARVIRGVSVTPSPLTVQTRLTASGMRPISAVVDATNYTMLETGQPLHPFDLDRLEGRAVIVRGAKKGERLTTLEGAQRELTAQDLVIADSAKAVGIAGVMGSAAAEVSSSTDEVLLESAHFERRGISRTARRHGLKTEASMRFERGADPEGVAGAADRAAALMTQWAGGEVLSGLIEVGDAPTRRRLSVRPSRASLIVGNAISRDDIIGALGRLELEARTAGEAVEVEVPGYRVDLEQEIDLIEEVARVQGYDTLGSTLPSIKQAGGLQSSYARRRQMREALVRAGLRESTSFSFASAADLELMGHSEGDAIRVINPLASDQAFLRTSLLPGVLRAVQRNLARQVGSVALFEVGRTFGHAYLEQLSLPPQPGGTVVLEREHAAFVLAGASLSAFPGENRGFDFFDAKGAVESLMEALGVKEWGLGGSLDRPFHPARSISVVVGGREAGVVGELHPALAEALDLPPRTAAAELDVEVLSAHGAESVTYSEVPRFPPVRRDLAFIVPQDTPAGEVRRALAEAGEGLVGSIVLFDVFTGGAIPQGKKSLAYSVAFLAPDRTLTDAEAEQAVRRMVTRVERDFGGELRS
ncbi:MAG: phenylalanine--tRNA ligase subunit beta [Actinomycetota bacterium]|nr:phenylalanine--tRNA ligase subunit beta [Actinomycetota bacterium]